MNEVGYAFALPRLLARIAGRKVRRAQWSAAEAYGLGSLVFLLPCVWLWHEELAGSRSLVRQILALVLVPLLVWLGCLLVLAAVWFLAWGLRRLGLYRAHTNLALQSFFILTLVSLCALSSLREPNLALRSLGIFWFGLVLLNFLAAISLRFLHER